jgi:anhydro-N-acetylmuramic acid kinase
MTLLSPGQALTGFDTGPANALLDLWCQRHTGQTMDRDGHWAQQGCVSDTLLQAMLVDPYFATPPPKSTGRDHFSVAWLDQHVERCPTALSPVDVQATLVELTVESVARAWLTYASAATTGFVCGGGAHNLHLMQRLAERLAPRRLATTQALGVPPQTVEAVAFAWLARACWIREPLDLTATTGARGPRVYGAVYAA